VLKQLAPVSLLNNNFSEKVKKAELSGAGPEMLRELLGKGRAKMGIFAGDLNEGALEIGQVASTINNIKPAGEILKEIWDDFLLIKKKLSD